MFYGNFPQFSPKTNKFQCFNNINKMQGKNKFDSIQHENKIKETKFKIKKEVPLRGIKKLIKSY